MININLGSPNTYTCKGFVTIMNGLIALLASFQGPFKLGDVSLRCCPSDPGFTYLRFNELFGIIKQIIQHPHLISIKSIKIYVTDENPNDDFSLIREILETNVKCDSVELTGFTDSNLESIIASLSKNSFTKKIKIHGGSYITNEGIQGILKYIRHDNFNISFSITSLSNETIRLYFEKSIEQNIKILDLSFMTLGDKVITVLCKFLTDNAPFEIINLAYTSLNDERLVRLAKALRSNEHIKSIDLKGNTNIKKGSGFNQFFNMLETNKTIKEIDLSSNNLSGSEVALASMLTKNNTLNLLIMQSLYDPTINLFSALTEALKSNKYIQKLDLSMNSLAPAEAQLLADAIRSNTTLKELYLNRVRNLGTVSIEILCNALHVNRSLRYFNIDNVRFDNHSLMHFLNMIWHNDSVVLKFYSENISQRNIGNFFNLELFNSYIEIFLHIISAQTGHRRLAQGFLNLMNLIPCVPPGSIQKYNFTKTFDRVLILNIDELTILALNILYKGLNLRGCIHWDPRIHNSMVMKDCGFNKITETSVLCCLKMEKKLRRPHRIPPVLWVIIFRFLYC